LRDASDAIGELDDAANEPPDALPTASASRRRKALVAGVVAALLLVAAALGWLIGRGNRASTERLLRFGIALPPGAEISAGESPPQLFTRSLAQFDLATIPGTERAGVASFSRDGQWLYFDAENKLWKVPAKGGARVLIAAQRSHREVTPSGARYQSRGRI